MKLSSAAITVAAISLLSSSHAAPLAFKNGEITGRLHHRRGSDLSELSEAPATSAYEQTIEDLDMGFESGPNLILPRILNFFKRQVSTGGTSLTASSAPAAGTHSSGTTSGTTDTDLHTALMAPDLESYGFASEGLDNMLAPVREIKE